MQTELEPVHKKSWQAYGQRRPPTIAPRWSRSSTNDLLDAGPELTAASAPAYRIIGRDSTDYETTNQCCRRPAARQLIDKCSYRRRRRSRAR